MQQRGYQHHRKADLDLARSANDKKAKIGSDQFITAAAGVQLPAERAEFFDKRLFDEVVNILDVCAKGFNPGRIGLRTLRDFVERGEGLLHFRGGENTNRLESFRPGTVYRDFLRQEAAIEREGTLKRVEARVRRAFKAAAPKFAVFAFGHASDLALIAG